MPRYIALYNLQPARCDIIHYRGDTLSINIMLNTHGMPLDLTEWTFTAHVRALPDGPQVAKFDIEVYDVEPNVIPGKITVFLTSAQSQALEGDMQWDLQAREESTGKQHTLIRGTIHTASDVTYPPSGPRVAALMRTGRRVRG